MSARLLRCRSIGCTEGEIGRYGIVRCKNCSVWTNSQWQVRHSGIASGLRNPLLRKPITSSTRSRRNPVNSKTHYFEYTLRFPCPEAKPTMFLLCYILLERTVFRVSTCDRWIEDTGFHFIPSHNDLNVMAGQGTIALELMQQVAIHRASLVCY